MNRQQGENHMDDRKIMTKKRIAATIAKYRDPHQWSQNIEHHPEGSAAYVALELLAVVDAIQSGIAARVGDSVAEDAQALQVKLDEANATLSAARERIRKMGVAVVPDLPTWEDGESKLQRGEKLTALEKFVMDHDWHKTDATFRNGLEAVFAELRALPSSRVAGEGEVLVPMGLLDRLSLWFDWNRRVATEGLREEIDALRATREAE